MRLLHLFTVRMLRSCLALAAATCLTAGIANADSPSSDARSPQGDPSNAQDGPKSAETDRSKVKSSADNGTRGQDRDATNTRKRQHANGAASDQSDSSRHSAEYRSGQPNSSPANFTDSDDNRPQDSSASQRQTGQTQTQKQRQRFGVIWADDDEHWKVDEVTRGGVAARVGLRVEDEVISLNGRELGSSRDFQRYLNSNQRVPMVISRDGRRQTLWLGGNAQGNGQQSAQKQFQQNQPQQSYSQNGGQAQDAQAYLGVQLNDQYQNMAVVKQALPNTPAQQAGLQAGDTITSINGQRISSPQQLTDEVQQLPPGATVQLQFSRPQARTVQVRIGGRTEASQASYSSGEQRRSESQDNSEDDDSSQSKDDDSQDSQSHSQDSEDHDGQQDDR